MKCIEIKTAQFFDTLKKLIAVKIKAFLVEYINNVLEMSCFSTILYIYSTKVLNLFDIGICIGIKNANWWKKQR